MLARKPVTEQDGLPRRDTPRLDGAHVVCKRAACGSHTGRHVTEIAAFNPAPLLLDQSKKAGGEVGGTSPPLPFRRRGAYFHRKVAGGEAPFVPGRRTGKPILQSRRKPCRAPAQS